MYRLMAAIEDEAPHMRDAGPCAVRTYELLVGEALAHLARFPNKVIETQDLRELLNHDLQKAGKTLSEMLTIRTLCEWRDEFAPLEHELLFNSIARLKVHLKVDMGMGRLGVPFNLWPDFLNEVK